MSEPDFAGQGSSLSNFRVAVLGLGLMGGSLALAIKDRVKMLLGADPNPEVVAQARLLKLFDRLETDPEKILPDSDAVILAAPIRDIVQLLSRLPDLHPGPAIVMDLGSTKVEILQAMDDLPERFDVIGAHPMCGKETAGLANAEAVLFRDQPIAFSPLPRTGPAARAFAEVLAATLAAHPVWLDGETHDRWTAATSHVPYLLSAALSLATPEEAAPLVGTGFRSAARLAASSPAMMMDILVTNREAVLGALQRVQAEVEGLSQQLRRGEYGELGASLARAQLRQNDDP